METKDLAEIEKMHDKANRALTDARYWRSHSNPSVRISLSSASVLPLLLMILLITENARS